MDIRRQNRADCYHSCSLVSYASMCAVHSELKCSYPEVIYLVDIITKHISIRLANHYHCGLVVIWWLS